MKELKKFYLFVHPPAHGPYLLGWKLDVKREEEWKELIRKEGQDEEKGVLIFSVAGYNYQCTKAMLNFRKDVITRNQFNNIL